MLQETVRMLIWMKATAIKGNITIMPIFPASVDVRKLYDSDS